MVIFMGGGTPNKLMIPLMPLLISLWKPQTGFEYWTEIRCTLANSPFSFLHKFTVSQKLG